jgi:transcriptional regulator with XRE-family HTH domain
LWGQEELARRLEAVGYPINRATIAKIESGRRVVTLDEVLIFALVFDVSPLHLVVPEGPTEPLSVTPTVRVVAAKARRWIRGWEALPEQDADRYRNTIPPQDTFFRNDPHFLFFVDSLERESLTGLGVHKLSEHERHSARRDAEAAAWSAVEDRAGDWDDNDSPED